MKFGSIYSVCTLSYFGLWRSVSRSCEFSRSKCQLTFASWLLRHTLSPHHFVPKYFTSFRTRGCAHTLGPCRACSPRSRSRKVSRAPSHPCGQRYPPREISAPPYGEVKFQPRQNPPSSFASSWHFVTQCHSCHCQCQCHCQ